MLISWRCTTLQKSAMSSTRLTPRHYWEGWEADLTEKTVPIQTGDLYPSFKICFLFSDLKIRSFAIKTKSVSGELYCECCAGFFLNLSLEWPKKTLFPVHPPRPGSHSFVQGSWNAPRLFLTVFLHLPLPSTRPTRGRSWNLRGAKIQT